MKEEKPDYKKELITGEIKDSRGRVIGIQSSPADYKASVTVEFTEEDVITEDEE